MPAIIVAIVAIGAAGLLVAMSRASDQQQSGDDMPETYNTYTSAYGYDETESLTPGLTIPADQSLLTIQGVSFADSIPPTPPTPTKIPTPEAYQATAYLKTFLAYMDAAGLTKGSVFTEAIDDAKARAKMLDFAKNLIDKASDSLGAAIGVAGGSAAAGATLGAATGGAFAVVASLVSLAVDEQTRLQQTRACNFLVEQFAKDYGLPPTSLIAYLAYKDGGDLPYEIVTGQGGFQRTREWGVGIIARYFRALLDIDATYPEWVKTVKFLKPQEYKTECRNGTIPAVFDGSISKLRPSRLAFWPRYVFHPASLFVDGYVPTESEWRKQNQADGIDTKVLSQFAERLGTFVKSGFVIDGEVIEDLMIRLPGFSAHWDSREGVYQYTPTALFFEIGHDPGFDTLPTPALGLAPGNYGSISFAKKDWLVRYEVNPNWGWLKTRK